MLFEFYNVYSETADKTSVQDFETFSNWAKIALQDFNEIDRYLLDSNELFDYLYEIERIKQWTPNLEKQTTLIENQLFFLEKIATLLSCNTKAFRRKKNKVIRV